jgi:hypothetical protein
MILYNIEDKLDIENLKMEMNKFKELDHECNKIWVNLSFSCVINKKEEDTLILVKEEL